MIQGYGASECSPIIACGAADGSTPIGTVGTPLHGVEVRLGTDGELFVRGPNVMRGYWADERRTAAAIDAQGWYHTGDLATLDAGGNIQLIGRARPHRASLRHNVWPEDVETLLRGHPLVQDAAVVAVSKEGGGTSLHAYLIRLIHHDRSTAGHFSRIPIRALHSTNALPVPPGGPKPTFRVQPC